MCEPATISAIVGGTTTAVVATAPVTAPVTATTVATTATVGGLGGIALTGAGSFGVGIGGAGLSSGVGLGGFGAGLTGVSLGGAGLTGGVGAAGISLETGLALASLAIGVGGGIASGVQAEQSAAAAKKTSKKGAASKKIAALTAQQQGAEAAAQKQFQASRAALAAKGKVKASNLGDRSVAALSRAVGFELGTDKATIRRNQQIANLEASARLFGIDVEAQSRRNRIGETGGLTLGLNTGATLLNSGVRSLKIRRDLSN